MRGKQQEQADERVYRTFQFTDVEVRAAGDEEPARIRGHAAVFDQAADIWGFREIVRPGAFRDVLSSGPTKALFNHDRNFVLGSLASGSLHLREDDVGLAITVDGPFTPTINDLVIEPMRKGDINKMSFAFDVGEERWGTDENGVMLREILSVETLYDVSPVTFPAYDGTDAHVRSALNRSGYDAELIAGIMMRRDRGVELTEQDFDVLKRHVALLESLLPPVQEGDEAPTRASDGQESRTALLRLKHRQLQVQRRI